MQASPTIHEAIIEVLSSFLTSHFGDIYTYECFDHDGIEVYAFSKDGSNDKCLMIRIIVLDSFEQIHIPNVFMPPLLQFRGIGKTMIRIVYEVGVIYGYDTFVVQLTDGFETRLLKRGALPTGKYNVLQIVEATNLVN